MNDKIVKKIGIKQDTGKYIYANIGVDADKVEIDEFTTLVDKLEEFDDKINNIEVGNYELPIASEEVLGGVKIGNGLEISEDGILNCTSSGSTDNTIELSKAEYDALPEDKLTNNITYFIKDMEIPGGSGSSNPTKERNMVFISDSYDSYSGWIDACAARLGLDNNHYHNIAQSGTGFFNASFNTLLSNYRGTITSDYAETITHIIVCGGVNDSTDPTDEHLANIYNNICNLADYAKTNFPNAKVYLGYIGYALENSSVLGGRNYKNRMTMCGYWSSACLDRDNMFYLNNVEYALHHLDYMHSDGLHPNYKGGINIARYVANAIETGSADVKFLRESFNITGINSTIEGEFNCYIDNEITHICMNNFSFHNSATWTMTHDDYLEFANIDSPYFQRFDPITIPAQIYENNKWINIFVTMKCENSRLYFKSATVNDSGWKSLVGMTMGFESVSFCIPTLSC